MNLESEVIYETYFFITKKNTIKIDSSVVYCKKGVPLPKKCKNCKKFNEGKCGGKKPVVCKNGKTLPDDCKSCKKLNQGQCGGKKKTVCKGGKTLPKDCKNCKKFEQGKCGGKKSIVCKNGKILPDDCDSCKKLSNGKCGSTSGGSKCGSRKTCRISSKNKPQKTNKVSGQTWNTDQDSSRKSPLIPRLSDETQ